MRSVTAAGLRSLIHCPPIYALSATSWAGRNSQHRTARADYLILVTRPGELQPPRLYRTPLALAGLSSRTTGGRVWRQRRPQPTIYWTYDGSTWNSKTLTGDAGTDQFFDLDSSPIIVGMTFYVSGVTYAIQTPYPGYVP